MIGVRGSCILAFCWLCLPIHCSQQGFAGSVKFHFVIIPLFSHNTVMKFFFSKSPLLLSCKDSLLAWCCMQTAEPQAEQLHPSEESCRESTPSLGAHLWNAHVIGTAPNAHLCAAWAPHCLMLIRHELANSCRRMISEAISLMLHMCYILELHERDF